MKLHLYTTAESECLAFGNLDKPDLYFEYYPDVYPARKGINILFNRLISGKSKCFYSCIVKVNCKVKKNCRHWLVKILHRLAKGSSFFTIRDQFRGQKKL